MGEFASKMNLEARDEPCDREILQPPGDSTPPSVTPLKFAYCTYMKATEVITKKVCPFVHKL
jgi:hypothetical protein